MRKDLNNNLSDAERKAMQSMTGAQAPPDLEDRTVAALKTQGLLNTGKGGIRMKLTIAFAAAAVIVVSFLSGVVVTKTGATRTTDATIAEAQKVVSEVPVAVPAAGANEYMLLMITESSSGAEAPPAEMTPEEQRVYEESYQAIIAEYRGWAEDRRAEGRLVSAEKLENTVRILTSESTSSELPEGRVLGGYFLIRADNMEEAEKIAITHPHIRYGGQVEIRPIDAAASAHE